MDRWAALGRIVALWMAGGQAVCWAVAAFTAGTVPEPVLRALLLPLVLAVILILVAFSRRLYPFDPNSRFLGRAWMGLFLAAAVACIPLAVLGLRLAGRSQLGGRVVIGFADSASRSCEGEAEHPRPIEMSLAVAGEDRQRLVVRACPRARGDSVIGFYEPAVESDDLGPLPSDTDCQQMRTALPVSRIPSVVVCVDKRASKSIQPLLEIRAFSEGRELKTVTREEMRWYESFGLWLP